MALYLNPNADAFQEDKKTRIYIDKSLLIAELNNIVSTKDDFICISRPRKISANLVNGMRIIAD